MNPIQPYNGLVAAPARAGLKPDTFATALSIAGSDPSGGAGIQADLKTFAAFGVYGMSVVTAVTAQNTCGVRDYFALYPDMVCSQLKCVFEDIPVKAVKTGMLVNEDIVRSVTGLLKEYSPDNLVVDPVISAKDGTLLLSQDAVGLLKNNLFPMVRLVTPNIDEAAILAGMDRIATLEAMKEASLRIMETGVEAVLVKGGHLEGSRIYDVFYDGYSWQVFERERIAGKEPHGTGCTLSAAITAGLAQGKSLPESVETAGNYTNSAISQALRLGKGYALLDHSIKGLWRKS